MNHRLLTVCAGGGVQPAVCHQREQHQEELRGALRGLRPSQEPGAGWSGGAGTISHGGADEDLRQLHAGQSLSFISSHLPVAHCYLF